MSEQIYGVGEPVPYDLEERLGALFDDQDFHKIHRRMSTFNLFEAVGGIRAELRHSNFLAYLLSPSRPHGLRAKPLAAVLRAVLSRLPSSKRPIMTLQLIAGELDDAIVYRERDNIDVLIEFPTLKFVVAIENKVGAKAAEGQLERYSQSLELTFPGYHRLLVFLTPEGVSPNHDLYVAYSYAELAEVLDALTADTPEPIPTETRLIIRHYVDMVRRHIVHDDKLRALARTLYERHKEAFEFIFECKPEPQNLLTVVQHCVSSLEGMTEDSGGSTSFRFVPTVWDEQLKTIKSDTTKWSKVNRAIMFEAKIFANMPGRVSLALILGPGDSGMRSRVYKSAAAQPQIFTGLVKPMGAQWATIFSRDLLTHAQAKNITFEAQCLNIQLAWLDFQEKYLPLLIKAVLDIDKELAYGG